MRKLRQLEDCRGSLRIDKDRYRVRLGGLKIRNIGCKGIQSHIDYWSQLIAEKEKLIKEIDIQILSCEIRLLPPNVEDVAIIKEPFHQEEYLQIEEIDNRM